MKKQALFVTGRKLAKNAELWRYRELGGVFTFVSSCK